jgi:hypothetical protein
LEQQDADRVIYHDAEKRTGDFYPDVEPKNLDGTYKRLVYNQINAMFYNTWKNPSQLFGMENIDFELGKTERHISDFFREFVIPKSLIGDKIVKGSVQLYENSLDDNVTITDDSYCNLIATKNLFSKIQEVRTFGNVIQSGASEFTCPVPVVDVPDAASNLTGVLTGTGIAPNKTYPFTVDLSWNDNSTIEDGFKIYTKFTLDGTDWTEWNEIGDVFSNVISYQTIIDEASNIISSSYYVTAYNGVGESTGSNIITLNISSSA